MNIQINGGSVRGKDHLMSGKNNQDSLMIRRLPNRIAAIVCDGCGSCSNSEVGAAMASDLLATLLVEMIEHDTTEEDFNYSLETAQFVLLKKINNFCSAFDERFFETLSKFFFFTTIGFVANKDYAAFFNVGDGCIVVNGEVNKIGPFENNAPPYLAYNFYEDSISPEFQKLCQLRVNKLIPIEELDTFLIGTDGASDLIDVEKYGSTLSDFWQDEKMFKNDFAVNRKLTLLNGGIPKNRLIEGDEETSIVLGNSILRDDTTLVIGKVDKEVTEDAEGLS